MEQSQKIVFKELPCVTLNVDTVLPPHEWGKVISESEKIKLANREAVDPDELKKALAYDRNQYQIGYENGKRDATKYAKWEINPGGYYPYCSNCLSEPPAGEMTDYCSKCGAYMKEDKDDA